MELFFLGFITALLIVAIVLHFVSIGIDVKFEERNNQCSKSNPRGE